MKQEISEQEYLDGELISEVKHEFIDGVVYAMAGASADHGRIAGNLFAAINLTLSVEGIYARVMNDDVQAYRELLTIGK